MSFLANVLEALGISLASGSTFCPKFWLDEPEMPKSLIEKM